MHLLHTFLDERTDLARRLCAALGQRPHFACHDRKAAPLFTCTGGLDRCIQRQNIGLEGQAVDRRHDLGHPVVGGVDLIHGGNQFGHDGSALPRNVRCGVGQGIGLPCRSGRLLHRTRQLLHGGRGFLQAACREIRARRQVIPAGGHLTAGLINFRGGFIHDGQKPVQVAARLFHFGHQTTQLRSVDLRRRKVAFGNATQGFACLCRIATQLAPHRAHQHPAQQCGPGHRQQGQYACKPRLLAGMATRSCVHFGRSLASGLDLFQQLRAHDPPCRCFFFIQEPYRIVTTVF